MSMMLGVLNQQARAHAAGSSLPLYEDWPGAATDPAPSARWNVSKGSASTLEQDGAGFLSFVKGTNGSWNNADRAAWQGVAGEEFSGEVSIRVKWGLSPEESNLFWHVFIDPTNATPHSYTSTTAPADCIKVSFTGASLYLYKWVAGASAGTILNTSYAQANGDDHTYSIFAESGNCELRCWDTLTESRPDTPTATGTNTSRWTGRMGFTAGASSSTLAAAFDIGEIRGTITNTELGLGLGPLGTTPLGQ